MTLVRDWPWTHTVYFVLHGLVMVMKQHSYAFTNGHLSAVYKERQKLLAKLKQLEDIEPAATTTDPEISSDSPTAIYPSISTTHLEHRPSASEYYERRRRLSKSDEHRRDDPSDGDSEDIQKIDEAIKSGQPLNADQLQLFSRLVKWEIDALGAELKGSSSSSKTAKTTEGEVVGVGVGSEPRWYPRNATARNFYEYVALPTLVYELQYPRSARVDWWYVAEKTAAMVGVIFVMAMVSQTFIYPVVVRALAWKEDLGWDTKRRFAEFPWLLSDLIFPFMMEYLVSDTYLLSLSSDLDVMVVGSRVAGRLADCIPD